VVHDESTGSWKYLGGSKGVVGSVIFILGRVSKGIVVKSVGTR
jgi:hypothetical protein